MRSALAANLEHPICARCHERHSPAIACAFDRVGNGPMQRRLEGAVVGGRVAPAPDLQRIDDEPLDWPVPERELSAGWGRRGRGEQ